MTRFPIKILLVMTASMLIVARVDAGERPLWGSGAGFFSVAPAPLLRGTGQVTHLGLSNLMINVDQDAWDADHELVPVRLTFKAADGDLLFADVEGGLDAETDILTGSLIFTGGTGRFEDAIGTAEIVVLFDELFGFDWMIIGAVSY